jgi:tetratricopeptide (TPR) repeat protein
MRRSVGSELAALFGFFAIPWSQPVAALSENSKAFVLNEAGYDLQTLGRVAEAVQPILTSLEAYIAQNNRRSSAVAASNLSGLYLTMGNLAQALDTARQSVELADHSGDAFERTTKRVRLADTLHQAGRLSEAETVLHEAEEMQKVLEPQASLLYSLQGFQCCDLLLSLGKYQEVQSRASQTIKIAQRHHWLRDIALDNLSLGCAYLQEVTRVPAPTLSCFSGEVERSVSEGVTQAATYLQHAVDGLRQAGQQDMLPLGLLARTELYRFTGDFKRAQNDLDEAFTIATRGGMRLHEADCHLEYARLYVAMNDTGKAREHFAKAKQMVEEIGYHRRDKEVQELEAMLQ